MPLNAIRGFAAESAIVVAQGSRAACPLGASGFGAQRGTSRPPPRATITTLF